MTDRFDMPAGDVWRLDPVLAAIDLGRVDLVSLDIFDTLLFRRVEQPADIFLDVGRRAAEAGLLDEGLRPTLFRQLRQDAERAACAAGGQPSLADIYAHMPAHLVDREKLPGIELAAEADVLFANPFLVAWMRRVADSGVPLVLTSDMYFLPGQLRGLLGHAGVAADLFQAIYVSAAHGCSKRDGGLFRCVLADWPSLDPARVVHIGDDPQADVASARAHGMGAVPYAAGPVWWEVRRRERSMAGLADAPVMPLRRLAAQLGAADPSEDAFWLAYGALVLGPAVAEYCIWVAEDCRRRGIDLIAPLMREGEVFAPLIEDYVARRGWPIRVEPLFVSRQALAPIELAGLNGDRARDILHRRPDLPWDRLLAQAGGTVPNRLACIAGLTFDRLQAARLPDGGPALAAVLALFDQESLQRAAAVTAATARGHAVAYLRGRFGDARRVALVDLGARGTIAARIHALEELRQDVGLHAYLCYAVPDLVQHVRDGLPASVFAADTDLAVTQGRVLYRSPQMAERVLTGLTGSTLGYAAAEDGRVQPVLGAVPACGEEARAIGLARAGVRRYWTVRMLTLGTTKGTDPFRMAGEAALFPLFASVQLPLPEEAARLGALVYDYNDGSGMERTICDRPALDAATAMLQRGAAPLVSRALGLRPLVVPWPQGALTLADPQALSLHYDAVALGADHAALCRSFVASIRRHGIERVAAFAVGGTGGMGGSFIQAAREQGLSVVAYTDFMPHLITGPTFHGVPVIAAEELAATGCRHVALVTLGFARQLAEAANAAFASGGLVPDLLNLES